MKFHNLLLFFLFAFSSSFAQEVVDSCADNFYCSTVPDFCTSLCAPRNDGIRIFL
jgi:hypothetical protein